MPATSSAEKKTSKLSSMSCKSSSSSSRSKRNEPTEEENKIKLSFTNWVLGGSLVTTGGRKVAVRRRNGSGKVDRVVVVDVGDDKNSRCVEVLSSSSKVEEDKNTNRAKTNDEKNKKKKDNSPKPQAECKKGTHCPHCSSYKRTKNSEEAAKKGESAKEAEGEEKKKQRKKTETCDHCEKPSKHEAEEKPSCCGKCGKSVEEGKKDASAVRKKEEESSGKDNESKNNNDSNGFTLDQDAKMMEMNKAGHPHKAIALTVGRSKKDVGKRIEKLKKMVEKSENGGNCAVDKPTEKEKETNSGGSRSEPGGGWDGLFANEDAKYAQKDNTAATTTGSGGEQTNSNYNSWGNANPTWGGSNCGGGADGNTIPDWDSGSVSGGNTNGNNKKYDTIGSGWDANDGNTTAGGEWMSGGTGDGKDANRNETQTQTQNQNQNQGTNTEMRPVQDWSNLFGAENDTNGTGDVALGGGSSGPIWGGGGPKKFFTSTIKNYKAAGEVEGNVDPSGWDVNGNCGGDNVDSTSQQACSPNQNNSNPKQDNSSANQPQYLPSIPWNPSFLSSSGSNNVSLNGKLKPDAIWSKEDCEALEILTQKHHDYRWFHIQKDFYNWKGRMVKAEFIEAKFREDLLGAGDNSGGDVVNGGSGNWNGEGNGQNLGGNGDSGGDTGEKNGWDSGNNAVGGNSEGDEGWNGGGSGWRTNGGRGW